MLDVTVSIGPSLCSVTNGPHFLSVKVNIFNLEFPEN